MPLMDLGVEHFRNLVSEKMSFDPKLNIIYGQNGGGKTSLLEAIYMLGMGRSFRTRLNRAIITHTKNKLLVKGRIFSEEKQIDTRVTIEKTSAGKTSVQINHDENTPASQLTHLMPTQIINSDSYLLINAGPIHRRHFIDWGVFHVEHDFHALWKRYNRALKQRNALLKSKLDNAELQAWGNELVESGIRIDAMRKKYLELFEPLFKEIVAAFLGDKTFKLEYSSGWSGNKSLEEAMAASKSKDLLYGSTQQGPHRGDLEFLHRNLPVHEVLSRGQQKLFISALYIAQNYCLKKICGKKTSYLIDDIGSELDDVNALNLVSALLEQGSQLFITCINQREIEALSQACGQKKMFHMEHGLAKEVVY